MPLPLPNLDDRRWADLVDEGRALIPRYAPDWTDHNVHDPGITLMELFAWLVESAIYRLNRVPPRHRRKFLSLVGFDPHPPRAAQTVFAFDPDAGTLPFLLPAGAEFEATDPGGQPVRFRTLRDLTVADARLVTVQVDAGYGVVRDRTRGWLEGLPIESLGSDPHPGAALYLGFDDLPTGTPIALAFGFQGPGNGPVERERIIREAAAQQEARQRVLPDIVCDPGAHPPGQPAGALPPHHSACVAWEVFTGETPDPWTCLEPIAPSEWPAIGQVADDTLALTLDGIVEVNLPAGATQTALGEEPDPRFYLRCRLTDGACDAPPALVNVATNGVVAEQAVPVWQTLSITAGVTPAGPAPVPGAMARLRMQVDDGGVIQALAFDPTAPDWPDVMVLDYQSPGMSTAGQITLELIQVGVGDGYPEQRVALPQAPVQIDDLRLYTHVGNTWQEWAKRNDLDASRRTDFHFTLDATSGEVVFGNGERGRVVPMGALILVAYRSTRADAGNIAAGVVMRPADTPRNKVALGGLPGPVRDQLSHIITNRIPAKIGMAEETLAEATGRAVETLHAHERLLDLCTGARCQSLDQVEQQQVRALRAPTRAVNLLDLERLALDVPGTRVARARAWAGIHPNYPCLQAPGVVTVVVVPDADVPRPEPSQGLIDAIQRYLDRRRMVCTRLEVVGPHYLEVSVDVRVRTRAHTDATRVREQINRALDEFLDPRSGGPDGRGWPFGRDVYRSEILQVIDGVPGVDHVLEISLSAWDHEPQCGNLSLCPIWLVTPGWHRIEMVSPSFADSRPPQHTASEGQESVEIKRGAPCGMI